MTALPLAAIVRVSSMGKRKEDSDSFHADDEQVGDVNGYCKPRGLTYELLPPELSISGGKPISERPSLRAAIEGVEAGIYGGIVVAYLSRLTRSRSGLDIWNRVEAAGGHVHTAREGIDTSTAKGRYIRDQWLAMAVLEREEHAEQHARRKKAATAAGIWQRRQTPRGYAKDPETRHLKPNDDASLVLSAFERRRTGATYGQLAALLGMTQSGVMYLLRNRVYLGELHVGPYSNPAAHPAIVDEELFEAVQRSRSIRPPRVHAEPALLAGLARCAGCGHLMRRDSINYACRTVHGGGHRCLESASISTRRLDAYVESIVRPLYEQATIQAAGDADASTEREVLIRAKAELAAYTAATSVLDVGQDAFIEGSRLRAEAVEMAQEALHAKLATMPATFTKGPWAELSVTDRNAWLRTFLSAVVVRKSGRGIILPVGERVRVLRLNGAKVLPIRGRGGAPTGLHPIRFGDVDSEDVVRPSAA